MAETELNVDELSVDELKEELRRLNLKVNGSKAVLRERLRAVVTRNKKSLPKNADERESKDEEADERDDESDEDVDSSDSANDDENETTVRRRAAKLPLSFKDVEDSLQAFSGIAPSDFHLFRSMAHGLADRRFHSYEEAQKWIDSWIASKDMSFFRRGIHVLPERWEKVVSSDGQYFK
ncbi:MOS1T transposase, partial [Pseudoatta argentina]